MVSTELIPGDEAERLAAVRRYDVLDTPPDGAFERITRLAARHFGVPIAIVSIVDADRIWFKSHHGVEAEETGRDPGLCASAILGDRPWVVENAATDPRAMANPLVAGELGLRFYAGAPLRTRDGHALGTLCVIDSRPRRFSEEEAETLADLAGVVMDELELRLASRRTVEQELMLRRQAEALARQLQASLLPPELPAVEGAEFAALYRPADAGVVGGDFYDVFVTGDACVLAVGDVSGKGPSAAAVTALARSTIRSAALWASGPAEILENLNRSMLIDRAGAAVARYSTVLIVVARPLADGFALTAAGAGHPPALLVGAGGGVAELDAAGPPAGWYEEAAYRERSARLRTGDRLLIVTDGVIEARTPTGMLGLAPLRERLAGAGPTAEAAIEALRGLVEADGVRVTDDIAAVALRAVGR